MSVLGGEVPSRCIPPRAVMPASRISINLLSLYHTHTIFMNLPGTTHPYPHSPKFSATHTAIGGERIQGPMRASDYLGSAIFHHEMPLISGEEFLPICGASTASLDFGLPRSGHPKWGGVESILYRQHTCSVLMVAMLAQGHRLGLRTSDCPRKRKHARVPFSLHPQAHAIVAAAVCLTGYQP